MAIITIAREMGALSKQDEEQLMVLNQKYNFNFIHKEVLERLFKERGYDSEALEKFDERKPGFFASIFSGACDLFLQEMKEIIFEEVAKSPCIVVGRGLHVLMSSLPHCLKVRFVAPMEYRIKTICAEHQCSESEAETKILKSDANRSGFCRFHYDADWKNPCDYDIVLNASTMSSKVIYDVLEAAYAEKASAANENEGAICLGNLQMSQKIIREIVFVRNLSVQFFDVKVNARKATLFGAASSRSIARQIEDAVISIDGIDSIENKIQVVGPVLPRHM